MSLMTEFRARTRERIIERCRDAHLSYSSDLLDMALDELEQVASDKESHAIRLVEANNRVLTRARQAEAEAERLRADLERVAKERDAATADAERLRKRTHEIADDVHRRVAEVQKQMTPDLCMARLDKKGREGVRAWLAARGADPEALDVDGRTVLYAVSHHTTVAIHELLRVVDESQREASALREELDRVTRERDLAVAGEKDLTAFVWDKLPISDFEEVDAYVAEHESTKREASALRAKLEACEEVLRLEARRKCADCNAGDRAGSGTSPARPGKSHPEEWWHDTGPYQSRCRAESIWDILTPSPTPTKEEQ